MLRTLADPAAVPIHRRLTSSLRALPAFLVIGAQRAGTSFLYSLLAEHPSVAPALVKENVPADAVLRVAESTAAIDPPTGEPA